VKKGVLIIVLTVATQLFASDKTRITVNNYTADSGEFVIHAAAAGKPIELLCNQDSPFCTTLAPGDYWMVDWTVPATEFRGDYICREVDLYPIAANRQRTRKLGEYCLVER
jgi:hypothetical protein